MAYLQLTNGVAPALIEGELHERDFRFDDELMLINLVARHRDDVEPH